MSVTLACCDASKWVGDGVDLILTNPYAPLPQCLREKPLIVSNFLDRKALCEFYVGGRIDEIGSWSGNLRNRVWVRNVEPIKSELSDLVEDEFEPGRGWFPLELPLRLLSAYGWKGMTVWDGFMGRGTVGKACQMLGMNFVGLDVDPNRMMIAREYLGC